MQPTTGEWMASTVEIMFMENPKMVHYAIADAHNAALTTLRLCRTTQAQTIAKLRIQLSEIVTVLQKFQSDCPLTDQMSAIIDAALAKVAK